MNDQPKKFRCDKCRRKFDERFLHRLGDKQYCLHDYEWARVYAAADYLAERRIALRNDGAA